MEYKVKTGIYDSINAAIRLIKWFLYTILYAAVAPFILLAWVFWFSWFAGLGMLELHEFFTVIVTDFSQDQWINDQSGYFLVRFSMIIVLAYRITTSYPFKSGSRKFGDYVERLSKTLAMKTLVKLKPKLATEENIYSLSLAFPTLLFMFVLASIFFQGSNSKRAPIVPITQVVKITKTHSSAAIRLSTGDIHSGEVEVEKQGNQWVLSFVSTQQN